MSAQGCSGLRALGPALALLLAAAACPADREADGYLWPFDRKPDLSSSFGEYRAGRFHMGVDLSTNGEIGVPVRAAADGCVTRVRCSPWGYGRAVYVRFNDGNTAVYGHLSGFREDLRDLVRREQHKRESYTVELEPAAGAYPVKRGEVVAFSGDTGIGPAHLHFELRDASGRPVNPRLLGMAWPDDSAPVFKSVLVAPRDPDSRVNGDVLPQRIALTPPSKKNAPKDAPWTCPPVRVRGGFAVGVDLVDPTPAGNKLGIHQARLIDPDGNTVFEVRHDTIAYEEHGAAFAYHPAFEDDAHYLLLWRWPGNAAASDAVSAGDGWCGAPEQEGVYRIELTDFMGNSAALELPVVADTPPAMAEEDRDTAAPTPPETTVDGELLFDAPGTFLVVTAVFPTVEKRLPELLVNGQGVPNARFFAVDKRHFRAAWPFDGAAGSHTVVAKHPRLSAIAATVETVAPGSARVIQWPGGPRLSIPAGAACGPLFLRAEPLSAAPAATVSARGPAWRIWPETAPLAAAAEVALPLPEDLRNPARAAVARRSGKGWNWLKSNCREGMVTARADQLGDFRVLEDDEAPRELEFAPNGSAPLTTRRPRMHAAVADAGSGIASWDLRCDGRWLLSAYDPEAGRINWERDEDLPPGPHEITLRLTDNAGNSSSSKHSIILPEK